MNKRFLSADAFQRDCARLAKLVFDDPSWQPDFILALWRGGAQPGVIISEVFAFLGRPLPHAIVKCASYAPGIGNRTDSVVFQGADAILDSLAGKRVLVVDDVFDTGKTAEATLARLRHADARIATGEGELFEKSNLSSQLTCSNGSRHTGAACTNHNHVVGLIPFRRCFAKRSTLSC